MVEQVGFRPYSSEISPVTPLRRNSISKGKDATSFEDILSQTEITFSAHARQRLQERGITLDGPILDRLSQAIHRIEAKKGESSLVMVDDISFIVNIPNRVVITCLDGQSRRGNVFTNIDSAVIM
ncbi:MAG: hypothetical protein PWP04_387 [Candidatus Atribacteria bacterium]|nr:hypothetical protein [Candidatus Atribacteria bacterium]